MDPQSDVAERASSRPVRSDVARKGPVFVDLSGRRGRLVRHAGALAGAVCFGYSAVLGMGFAGGTAIAPETLIPGHPVTTEAFGREPKSAVEGHSGGRSGGHEHPSEGRYRGGGPDRPRPYARGDVRPASARRPTALARPAPSRPHRAPRHQRSQVHRPGHARQHKPTSSPARPAPHKPHRRQADPAPGPARKPPAVKPGTPVWGSTTPGGFDWQSLTPFRGGVS
ncbi:hypothetical protein [Streptomyces sp. NPDC021212]|uniref:hypothetical protein n=1 Tax=Streptomyces sp. NPDC021212 TaxID=3365118 RepID=UPI00378CBF68